MPRRKKTEEPSVCRVCGEKVFPGKEFCTVHYMIDAALDSTQEAIQSGDFWGILKSGFSAVLIDKVTPMIQPAIVGAAAKFAQPRPQQRSPRPPPRIDPWQIIGMDKSKATAKDIKEAQKSFNLYFHPDKGHPVNPDYIKQWNAAASECLKEVRSR